MLGDKSTSPFGKTQIARIAESTFTTLGKGRTIFGLDGEFFAVQGRMPSIQRFTLTFLVRGRLCYTPNLHGLSNL
jgi:hypothetical protein